MKAKVRLYFVLAVLFLSSQSFAEIYQWKDAQGNTHFGDELPDKNVTDAKKHSEKPAPLLIQGSKTDKERNRKQASSWYRKRLNQSRVDDAKKKRDDISAGYAKKARRSKCDRYKKYLSDTKDKLRAHKRAGVRPRVENNLRMRIKQYERDVDYYC